MKIALIGYGKMGQTIDKLALNHGHEIVGRIDADNRLALKDVLKMTDVAIEFSHPDAAFDNIRTCLQAGIPVISGTTGWLSRMDEVRSMVKDLNGTFLYASNFSVGVNLFFALNTYLAKLMAPFSDYRASMTETHHTAKKDAPSGTAISLAEDIISHHDGYTQWALGVNHMADGTLPIVAIREGDVIGQHSITYHSQIDSICITHHAEKREAFARGALLAAEFIHQRKGLYTMQDVLKSAGI